VEDGMTTIFRPGLERIPAYAPPPMEALTLDLRDNVNLWGAPPAATAALRAAPAVTLSSYPGVSAARLTDLLAERLGVRTDEVVAGCGSDDLIDACFRAVAAPGERVAHPDPSFSMVPRFARLNGLEPVGVPLRADGAADIDAMLATGARIIYLCSPNNPTGTVTPEAEIRRCIAEAPGIVMVDEAYAEFASARDWRADAPGMERVLVLRTFSKAWGLAGLRVGYGAGSRTLVDAVVRSRGPYKVNALAELAASTAVREDEAWMRAAASEAILARGRLDALVRGRRGVRAWASEGNFVFWQVDGDANAFAARFAAHGIGVRAFSGLPGIGEALRIGVAPWAQLERLAPIIEELWP
jgi:histidinol-phosphate aminotransferase